MKKLIIALSLFSLAGSAQAQIKIGKSSGLLNKAAGVASTGKLLTQLASGIAPNSFVGKWATAKSSWMDKASNVTSAAQGGQLLSQLAGYIKPTAFKSGFAAKVPALISSAKTVSTLAGVGCKTKQLVGGMKDEALTSSFLDNKSSYLSALSLLN